MKQSFTRTNNYLDDRTCKNESLKKENIYGSSLLLAFLLSIFTIVLKPEFTQAQISYSVSGSSYTQDFNNLYGTVPANNTTQAATILPAGWLFTEAGTNANTTLRNDNGSSGTGDTYLYGSTTSNERAFGAYASGSLNSNYGCFFVNNTGSTLTQFTLSYTGEQWKDGGSGTAVFNTDSFAYAINPASITSGTYIKVTQLDFAAQVNNTTADATLDGNLAANKVSKSFTVTGISWTAGSTLYLRWFDPNDTGNDDGLAIDDVTFTASTGAVLATKLAVIAVNAGTSPSATDPFSITVQSQNVSNGATNVIANTSFSLTASGAGSIGGMVTGTILAGTSSAIITGVTYSIAQTGVTITATRTSGDVLTAGTSAPFNVLGPPTQLAFVTFPSAGSANTPVPQFTVEARRADNSVDLNYTGTVTLSLNSGPGSLSGTLSTSCVSGVATFSNVSFTSSGTCTVLAQSGTLTNAISSSINILNPSLTEVLLPQYIQGNSSTNTNRTPYAYLVTLSGLLPNATYRYINQVVISSDAANTAGAGNVLFADNTAFYYTASTSFSTVGQYGQLTTNGSGSYTGWFITVPTGNARFTPGNNVYMRIRLNDGAGGTSPVSYLTTTNSVKVVNFGSTISDGSALSGNSNATGKNFVVAYDNVSGTGRPVAASVAEFDGYDMNDAGNIALYYLSNVELNLGTYGFIIPNNNAAGIRRFEQRALVGGGLVGCADTDADGIWPSGANTVNPSTGTTDILITATDAPLTTTRTITASAGAGGSVSPSGAVVVNCGDNQTFNITPNSCYEIADVIVDGSSVGPLSTYTFSNVIAAHTITATFNALIPASISNPGNQNANTSGLCSAVVNYAATVSGTPTVSVSYSFTGATTASGSGTGSGSTFNVGVTAVTITVSNVCNTTSISFNVTVTDNENPVISCPSNIIVCDPGSPIINFSVTATDNCGILSIVSTPASGSSFPQGTTTVNSIATDVNGNTSNCSFTVTVNSPSTAPTSISSDDLLNDYEICSGDAINLTQVGGSLGTGASYAWYTGSCGGASAGSGNSIMVSPTSTTTYYVRAVGTCNTTACASVTIKVKTSGPGGTVQNVVVPASGCVGNTVSVSVPLIPNTTYYNWSGPAGTTFNGMASPAKLTTNAPTVVLGAPLSSGWSICVQGENACGVTINTKCSFIRGTVSQPGAISGSAIACLSTSGSYTIAAVAGADSYEWTMTGNATVSGTGTTGSVTFGPAFTGGTLCVRAKLNCGTASAYRCMTISNTTAQPAAITGASTACPSSSSVYSIPAVAGATSYNWTVSCAGGSASGTGTSATITFPASFSSCVVCVTANSSCGVPSASRCKTVTNGTPGVPSSIAGMLNGVCNTVQNYSCPSVAGALSYNWSVVGGSIQSGNGTNSISVNWNGVGTTGTLSVVASNGCGNSGARTVNIRLVPGVNAAITGDASVACNSVGNYTVGLAAGAAGYNWSILPAGPNVIPSGNTALIDFNAQPSGNYTVYATSFNGCGNGNTQTFVVNVTSCARVAHDLATGSQLEVSAYPNPAHSLVTVNFNSSNDNNYTLKLVDLSSRVVYNTTGKSLKGNNVIDIDLSSLAKGVYMLQLNNGSEQSMIRLIVE